MRIGIIGTGLMGTAHSRAVRGAGEVLAGVASSSAEKAQQAAAEWCAERAYNSPDELIAAGDIDVVHICAPNAVHARLSLGAIQANKHVVCEKPLATTVSEALEVTDSAAAQGIVGTVPFVYRFHPLVREARSRWLSRKPGRALTIKGSYLQDWLLDPSDTNWRVDEAIGGRSRAFADIGSHLVDLIEFVTGDRIIAVAATNQAFFQRSNTTPNPTEDASAVVLRTEGGAIGTILVSQVAPGRKNQLLLEIAGTNETIEFNQEIPEFLWIRSQKASTVVPRDANVLGADAARLCMLPAGHPQGYQDAFNAFVRDTYSQVRGYQPEGLPTFVAGLRAAQITESIMEAAATREWVAVP